LLREELSLKSYILVDKRVFPASLREKIPHDAVTSVSNPPQRNKRRRPMLPVKKGGDRSSLETVQELFDGWRKEKKFGDPIPPSLWEAALSLMDSHSVYTIAKLLRLNYTNLKARAEPHPAIGKDDGLPSFIELDPMTLAVDCTIEMTKPTGERMTIIGSCNVAELARVFLG
jgi:hypothetical protein